MEYSAGIFLFSQNEDKFLICHPTGADKGLWSIPKGHLEEGETPWQAALRELREETGLTLDLKDYNHTILPLPQVKYRKRRKTLLPFVVVTDEPLYKKHLWCEPKDDGSGRVEMDGYKWATPDFALTVLIESQVLAYRNYKAIQWWVDKGYTEPLRVDEMKYY